MRISDCGITNVGIHELQTSLFWPAIRRKIRRNCHVTSRRAESAKEVLGACGTKAQRHAGTKCDELGVRARPVAAPWQCSGYVRNAKSEVKAMCQEFFAPGGCARARLDRSCPLAPAHHPRKHQGRLEAASTRPFAAAFSAVALLRCTDTKSLSSGMGLGTRNSQSRCAANAHCYVVRALA